jgi:hypothetical protein
MLRVSCDTTHTSSVDSRLDLDVRFGSGSIRSIAACLVLLTCLLYSFYSKYKKYRVNMPAAPVTPNSKNPLRGAVEIIPVSEML